MNFMEKVVQRRQLLLRCHGESLNHTTAGMLAGGRAGRRGVGATTAAPSADGAGRWTS